MQKCEKNVAQTAADNLNHATSDVDQPSKQSGNHHHSATCNYGSVKCRCTIQISCRGGPFFSSAGGRASTLAFKT